jgi:hypothetical protein
MFCKQWKTTSLSYKNRSGRCHLREYKVLLGLKTGKEYSFIVIRESKQEIIEEIRNTTEEWYTFVSDYIDYLVDKREIISIGIEMNEEEIYDHVRKLNHAISMF